MSKIEDRYDNEEVKRVLFHEIGHYLANKINYENGQPFYSNAISLMADADSGELLGRCESSAGYSNEPSKETLAQDIGRLSMGCIFQSYFSDGTLLTCYRNNGHSDYIAKNSRQNKLIKVYEKWKHVRLLEIEEAFLDKLLNCNGLDFLNDINPIELLYIVPEKGMWSVDIDKLEAKLDNQSVKTFKVNYLAFLTDLNRVINH
ncbi:hypothetical protein [Emticicia sp. C21]|uniref:hypothetical protein n=1 Tax=Emticicia sp. C21 TaxID=2302915 RepID=UPI000E349646|nr:hypothetical protein [Emticicia sp. C21]RFS16081.1 hypothetical protein D0T08_14425 [Emticicia sp. C21]